MNGQEKSDNERTIIELRERARFFILHRRWGLALDCLDRVLARPRDEDEAWRPCAESLLLRARVRLATADTAGALHDAQFVADTTRDNEGRSARAMVLKAQCCQAMFSMGEWEHALVYFHRVERLSRGTSRSAGIGVQRCLEAINKAVSQIQLQQPAQKTSMIIGNKRKNKNSSALPGQMVSRNTKVFNGDAEFLENLQTQLSRQSHDHSLKKQRNYERSILKETKEAIDYINNI